MKRTRDCERVSRADLVIDGPVDRSESGLPIGNGRIGTLVWTDPGVLHIQANRVDVFPCNRQTRSFHFHRDFCCGCGAVDVDFGNGANVFGGGSLRQHLDLYNAVLTCRDRDVDVRALVWTERDVIVLHIDDRRADPAPIRVDLHMLRDPLAIHGKHRSVSRFEQRDDAIVLHQEFSEGDYACASALAVTVEGRAARAAPAGDRRLSLCIDAGRGTATVLVAGAAAFELATDLAARTIADCRAAARRGWDGMLADNRRWWHDFWSKSFVELRSDSGEAEWAEQHYTYFLYIMASSSRGAFAPKFNGMLWNTGGDTRMWGAQYWWNNTCLLYRPLPAANHVELMDPLFDLYWGMREACARAARDVWKSQGLYIPETVWFDGPETLPPDIAAETSDLMLYRKPWAERSDTYERYAEHGHEFSCWWNWVFRKDDQKEPGRRLGCCDGAPSAYITHIFGSMARVAYQFWLRYEYTGDNVWLRERAYPMLKGVAEFFRHFPNLGMEADGRYHIRRVNHSEGIRGARDTMGCISGMLGVLPAAIAAAEQLQIDAPLQEAWQELLDDLTPLPTSHDPDACPHEPDRPAFWACGRKPVNLGEGGPVLDPVTHFDLCTLETCRADAETATIAENTYRAQYPDGVDASTPVGEMSKIAFAAARLGRADDCRRLLLSQLRVLRTEGDFEALETTRTPPVLQNRMTLREGTQALGAQRLGNAASALQEALCQSVPPAPARPAVIHLFAAWPRGWDAAFRLLCRGGFLVSAAIDAGRIGPVEVLSQVNGHCRVRNPWPGTRVTARRDDGHTLYLRGPLLQFETQAGERWSLEPAT